MCAYANVMSAVFKIRESGGPASARHETARKAYATDLVVAADRNGDRDGALSFAEYYELVCGTLAQYDSCVAPRRGATHESYCARVPQTSS